MSSSDLEILDERPAAASLISSMSAPAPPRGERVTFTDSEESERERARQQKKRKKSAISAAKPTTNRTNTKPGSLVGRRKLGGTRRRRSDASEESDAENDLMEHTLPQYLQERRKEWREEQQKELGESSPHQPPSYADIQELRWERNLAEKPQLPGIPPPAKNAPIHLKSKGVIPASIAKFLKPYQVEGTDWLHAKFVKQRGCLLGDDMGLGKTIQVIAFLTVTFGKTGDERDVRRMRIVRKLEDGRWYPKVLIVCPGTLMENWRTELDRWGWWHVYKYHGSPTEKEAALSAAEAGRLEIMITTYDTYKKGEGLINMIKWDCVIADECHLVKERKSQITQAMNNVNALCRIGLSGTTIQNKYEELWTLLNWTNPGEVGSAGGWKRMVCVPLKVGQSHDATNPQLAKARSVAEQLRKRVLPKFFLRRTKALIADQLTKKTDRVVFCPLTDTQAEAYNNFVDSELVHTIRDSSEECPCGSGKKNGWCCNAEVEGFGDWKLHVFPVLHTLQKIANHLGLLPPTGTADPERHERDLEKMKFALPESWREMYATRDSLMNMANAEFCGKYKVLKKLLKLWYDNSDKVLIFSHSVRLLRMLDLLLKSTTDYNISYLDGSMQYIDRQAAVDEYNSDPNQFAFLISTKAGGMGLNITSANKVVVVDPNWNPAYDLQAQDRAYRIGQTRDVEVFRLVSVGTIEEIVYARQVYKQQQASIGYNASVERRYFKGVQGEKDQKGEIFGLRNLFAPLSENVVLRDIVNKTNIAETRAGVEVTNLDLELSQEDEEEPTALGGVSKEDAAMTSLAAEIIDEPGRKRKLAKETAKKKDPVQAILASAGVKYTHENAEVIGTSKIEMKLSSRAKKDLGNEYVFAREAAKDDDLEQQIRYKYRPSEEVRKRQFCSMAKAFGYEDVTEFALVVEGWTQEQRRDCLERFYRDRRELIALE